LEEKGGGEEAHANEEDHMPNGSSHEHHGKESIVSEEVVELW
jgi:hypothetical protein